MKNNLPQDIKTSVFVYVCLLCWPILLRGLLLCFDKFRIIYVTVTTGIVHL